MSELFIEILTTDRNNNNNVFHFLSASYAFLCADVSVGNLLDASLLSACGHCQGACRLQMLFYIRYGDGTAILRGHPIHLVHREKFNP